MTVIVLIITVSACDSPCCTDRHSGLWLEWSAAASADLRVWFGSVRSGQNKFVQLLIRSWNSSGWFVRSLKNAVWIS